MNEKIILMTKKLETNPELIKQIAETKDVDKAYTLLDGETSGVTLEEFQDAVRKFRESCELADVDLEKVAAGSEYVDADDILFGAVIWAAAL